MVVSDVKLCSDCGVDYTTLQDLLASGQWKAASRETTRVMRMAARQTSDREFSASDVEKLPCADLRTIDQLWVASSEGHFGFSVQYQIWESLGKGTDWDSYSRLGEVLGWRRGGSWISFFKLTHNLQAPSGHLPFSHRWFFSVMNRLETCQI
ncbi:GUN4 domain-containing protein [Capilliphycus salinus ALCB114379]|uniref:GUN4 domain-containing protein n=1 Tax=Capilliphycus salinus TaxID=2768948 RepID=UPI0039A59E92